MYTLKAMFAAREQKGHGRFRLGTFTEQITKNDVVEAAKLVWQLY